MTFYTHGTSQIFYEATGHGEPVILLPGFSERSTDHAALLTLLAAHYRVVAVDLPGSGRSLPQPRSYSVTYYQEDAEALSALIRSQTDGPVHLIGFSDGGEVALLIAALDPDLVRSVLVWGAAGAAPASSGPLLDALEILFDDPVSLVASWGPHLVDRYGEPTARAMIQSFVAALRAIVAAGGDISRGMAGKIACPLLLIAGEDDIFVTRAMADDFAFAARNARAIEVLGAGHDVHNARPDWFAHTVQEWLASN